MSESSAGGGLGLGSVLFIVFLVLKLCGVIAWSWWWITAPLWIPAGIALIALSILGVGILIEKRNRKKRSRKFYGK